jgi:hypothetical protein
VTEFSKTFLVFYQWPDLTDVQGILTSTVGVSTSEREGKLSNPRTRAARAPCRKNFYGNLRETRAGAPRASYALILP